MCEDHVAGDAFTEVFERFVVDPFVAVAVLLTFGSCENEDQWVFGWRTDPVLFLATETFVKICFALVLPPDFKHRGCRPGSV
jgi:hypothetical protein